MVGLLVSIVSSAITVVAPNAYPTTLGGSFSALGKAVVQNASTRVWVNTASGVYHCPGTRYYGATKRGKYLSEQDARDQGYRGAYGRTCGSLTSPKGAAATPQRLGIAALSPSIASTKVWVNTKSGVYHCPGTRYYGATKSGRYMSEAVARDSTYRPAYGKPCA
jgi:hypothetical protein